MTSSYIMKNTLCKTILFFNIYIYIYIKFKTNTENHFRFIEIYN